jgi:ketosteroid isomerase-like protein
VVHDGRMSATSEMADLLKTFYSSISTGDPSAFAASMASDVLVIGTDEVEWWQGKDEVLRVMEAQVSEMHDAGIRFTGGDPQVFDSGDAVWAADRPTLQLPDGTSMLLRLSVVATRDGDALLVRQVHLSAGAPNEDMLNVDLTV